MLDVARLHTLREVLDAGSFSAAAARLHLTQPAVSRQIALLEREVGTLLVRRGRHGVSATEAGQRLADHAVVITAQLARAEADIRQLAGLRQGTVRLGSFFTALVHLSAEIAAELDRRHPGLVLVDDLVDRTTALEKVRRGNLDLALVFDPPLTVADPIDGLRVIELFRDPVCLVLPAMHPRARQTSIRAADLAADTWVRPHSGSAARLTDSVFALAGIDPPVLAAGRGEEPVETQALVAAGQAVALTYQLTVVVSHHALAIVPLEYPRLSRRICVLTLPGRQPPAVETTLAVIRKVGARHRTRGG